MKTKIFLIKLAVFSIVNMAILITLPVFFSGRHANIRLDIDHTESNLFVIGKNEQYKLVLLGTSRGRIFSRDGNHGVVEKIIGGKVANLSKGGGGGLMPAELHLSHFFDLGNSTGDIVYLVDPWVFFAAINNEKNDFFLRDEPFELSIFLHMIKEHYPVSRLFSYLQMIPEHDWAELSRYKEPGLAFHTLKEIDLKKQEEARNYYLKSYGDGDAKRYFSYVDKIVNLARDHHSRITFILLPILMKDFPGAAEVDQKLRSVAAANPDVRYYNMIGAMQDRHFFYDHMHFNRVGITAFATRVLLPIINGGKVEAPVFNESTNLKE